MVPWQRTRLDMTVERLDIVSYLHGPVVTIIVRSRGRYENGTVFVFSCSVNTYLIGLFSSVMKTEWLYRRDCRRGNNIIHGQQFFFSVDRVNRSIARYQRRGEVWGALREYRNSVVCLRRRRETKKKTDNTFPVRFSNRLIRRDAARDARCFFFFSRAHSVWTCVKSTWLVRDIGSQNLTKQLISSRIDAHRRTNTIMMLWQTFCRRTFVLYALHAIL